MITKEVIFKALESITAPGYDSDVVTSGLVSSVVLKGNDVGFVIEVAPPTGNEIGELCKQEINKIPGVGKISAVLTSPSVNSKAAVIRPKSPVGKKASIKGIKYIIAVGSGKGGVGKSTVAVNLAVALANLGNKVGLVDADIHGPSVSHMMGLKDEPPVEDNRMIPPEKYGVKCMSMGMLVKEGVPVIWRGPMITKALQQLMMGARWCDSGGGELDFLVIDLPPGTGDIHLSIIQNFKIDGAVIVTTPQEVALLDVKKAIGMFEKVNVPILGIVENMSYLKNPDSGEHMYIFGKGAVSKMASDMGIEMLASLPIDPQVSSSADNSKPALYEIPESDFSEIFVGVAESIKGKVT